jgi:threonyl-tRNA synthetase
MLIVGQKEVDEGAVSIRLRDGKRLPPMKIMDFVDYIEHKITIKSLDL